MTDIRQRFARLADLPEAEVDVARGALLIAAEERPGLDVEAELGRLDALAERLAPRLAGAAGDFERLAGLTGFLYDECGFAGAAGDDYYHPDNSCLDRVLDNRRGIPLTLALVLTEVGRRVGVPLAGVGFPGHFLVRHRLHPEVVLDPFDAGRVLTRCDCAALLTRTSGGRLTMSPRLLCPSPPRQILLRLLNNLRAAHLKRGDLPRALAAFDRALLLAPGDPAQHRARGMLRLRVCDFAGAVEDLELYLQAFPEAADRGAVEELVACARRRLRRLH